LSPAHQSTPIEFFWLYDIKHPQIIELFSSYHFTDMPEKILSMHNAIVFFDHKITNLTISFVQYFFFNSDLTWPTVKFDMRCLLNMFLIMK